VAGACSHATSARSPTRSVRLGLRWGRERSH
jgi:hypothetical protein